MAGLFDGQGQPICIFCLKVPKSAYPGQGADTGLQAAACWSMGAADFRTRRAAWAAYILWVVLATGM